MKEIFDFIEDASSALDLLSRYYRISYDESKIVYSKDGFIIEDGMTEELEWGDRDVYNIFAKEDESRYTFNDACEQLINKYKQSTDIFSEANKYDGEYYTSLIESQFLKTDEVQRNALIKKLIRSSFIFLIPNNYPLYEVLQPDNTSGVFEYRCFMSDEEIEEYEQKDEIGMYRALPVVSWLIEECCKLFNGVGTLCSDYSINLLNIAENVFNNTTLPLRFGVFGAVNIIANDTIEQPSINKNEDKLGAPSVRERIILIKSIMNYVYEGFNSLDDSVQMRFINNLTGIDKNAKNISSGSIKPAFDALKKIENGLDTSSKSITSYNSLINKISDILMEVGIDKLSDEMKKKKIEQV